ncbi:thiamine ABC transporter substrate-binding protein [Ornithinimicrobium pratense]|uniref:Thiamine ABC transporter substrate-binding protein n=1 Tax=Ornithinimicrobium pratense TaxID=2593973 RepID=A0A5J6V9N8_9MICO|nr:thiamine ABC transporter substrate-binding protein [Ornithinimicrobium pratense]QFG69752.1 thiamine ABC transporter substrate-binding protein [Ornithinimicrobium pratense]
MRYTRALALAATLTLTATSACTLAGGDEETPEPTSPGTPAPVQPPADEGDGDETPAEGGAAADDETSTGDGAAEEEETTPSDPGAVTLIAHDSFYLPDELVEAFEAETGIDLEIQLSGDAGAMANQVVLTAGSPVADVVFGIDNTFAARVIDADALEGYTPDGLPESVAEHDLEGPSAAYLTPVDYGDVCVNVDNVWFANQGIAPPQTLADLVEPEYENLFVTPGATTSSPGMSFLLATIGEFGPDEWHTYWEELMANGAKVTSGWTDAYTVDFTGGGGEGDRPIVLSYASSPPFTIPEGGWEPTTSALLDTCFRQVEYAGVLAGAGNPEGAHQVIDWLLSEQVQAAIPDAMYMYPVHDQVVLPEIWAQWAAVAEDPIVVHPQQIEAERETWLREWADIATG